MTQMDETAQTSLLEGLLKNYSPTLQEAPAVGYLAGQMEALGQSAADRVKLCC